MAVTSYPMLHSNIMTLCFIEPELWPIEVLHCGNAFWPFCSCDLGLDPMTFIFALDPYPWKYTRCVKINFLYEVFRKLSYYSLQMHALSYTWSLTVTWQRWPSHHSMRSSQKLHDTRKPHGSIFYRTGIMVGRIFSLGFREYAFLPFCSSCDLEHDLMTFIYELDLSSKPAKLQKSIKIRCFWRRRVSFGQNFRYKGTSRNNNICTMT